MDNKLFIRWADKYFTGKPHSDVFYTTLSNLEMAYTEATIEAKEKQFGCSHNPQYVPGPCYHDGKIGQECLRQKNNCPYWREIEG